MLGKLREKYQKAMMPIGRALAKSGITPNQLTFISFIISIIGGVFFAFNYIIIGVICILLTSFVDMLDGSVARVTGKETKFGAVWDHVLDRYAEFCFIFGIGLSSYANGYIAFLTLFSMVMASFTRAKAESVGKVDKCTIGIAERQEKLIILIIGCLITIIYPVIIILSLTLLDISLLIITLLSQITVIQRLKYTWSNTGGA
ncbi:MAG: CDP-alcohol phosphatidyltransferase family protein [Candidatus Odinarchaeia archaeon]